MPHRHRLSLPITSGVPILDAVLVFLLIFSVVLAIAAGLLSRRRPRLRATAWALTSVVVLDAVRLVLDAALRGAPLPYAGASRVLFSLDVLLFCSWPAPFVALAWHVLPRRRWWPPLAIFAAWGVLLVLAYPELHGPAMVAAQGLTRPLALLLAVEALLSLRRRLPAFLALAAVLRSRTGALVVAALAVDMFGQTMGTWLEPWPALPAWDASRVVTAMTQVMVAGALVWESRRGRTVS